MNKKIIMVISFVGVLLVILTILIFSQKPEVLKDISEIDMPEIHNVIKNYNIEFESERGFGNDRFDIYSFTLKDDTTQIFNEYDENFDPIYSGLINMTTRMKSQNKNTSLKSDIEKIKEKETSVYKYVHEGGTKKLYLYNKEMNKGYCLILTI